MALVAYNLTIVDLTLAAGSVILPASTSAGIKGPKYNVTAEMRPNLAVDPDHGVAGGLEAADFIALQAQVAAGDVVFEWTEEPEYVTGALTIGQYFGAILYVGPYEEYKTIQEALTAADGMGVPTLPVTIKIKDGSYTENLTLVDQVKLVAEVGGHVLITGSHTVTVAAGEDWSGSFHNISFNSGGAVPVFTLDNAAGVIPSAGEWVFRNCTLTSNSGGGSLTRSIGGNVSFYDSNLNRTVAGTDLIFVSDDAVAYLNGCNLTQVDRAQMVMSSTGSGSINAVDSELTGYIRASGTGTISVQGCKIFGGTAAVSAVESHAGTTVNILDCVVTSDSTRSRKTFTGDGVGGEINIKGCRWGSDVYFPKDPTDPLVLNRDMASSDLEMYSAYTTRVVSDVFTNLLVDGGTTPSTDAVYRINLSAGSIICSGLVLHQGALTDTVILGAGTWGKSWDLTGVAPTPLADGDLCEVALVAINVGGSVALHAVFGASVTGPAVPSKPTPAQVSFALEEAGVYGGGTIIGYLNLARVGAAVNETATDPASDATLASYRGMGVVFSSR